MLEVEFRILLFCGYTSVPSACTTEAVSHCRFWVWVPSACTTETLGTTVESGLQFLLLSLQKLCVPLSILGLSPFSLHYRSSGSHCRFWAWAQSSELGGYGLQRCNFLFMLFPFLDICIGRMCPVLSTFRSYMLILSSASKWVRLTNVHVCTYFGLTVKGQKCALVPCMCIRKQWTGKSQQRRRSVVLIRVVCDDSISTVPIGRDWAAAPKPPPHTGKFIGPRPIYTWKPTRPIHICCSVKRTGQRHSRYSWSFGP
jgi:hypothetical protein